MQKGSVMVEGRDRGGPSCIHRAVEGVDWVEPGVPITRADLEAWERNRRKAGPGDVVLLYIGRWKRRGRWDRGPAVAGYYADTIPWMHERLPALSATISSVESRPGWEDPTRPYRRAQLDGYQHCQCLDLEQAAATARRLNRYEFLITFAPLPVEGGTGSPVNPLAIF